MKQYTAQQIFDTVATHLIKQGKPALNAAGLCRYRGLEGSKCAFGVLISDEMYHDKFEGYAARGLIKGLHFNVESAEEHARQYGYEPYSVEYGALLATFADAEEKQKKLHAVFAEHVDLIGALQRTHDNRLIRYVDKYDMPNLFNYLETVASEYNLNDSVVAQARRTYYESRK